MINKTFEEMTVEELKEIIDHFGDYEPETVDSAKQELGKRIQKPEDTQEQILEKLRMQTYYLEKICKRINGISIVVWIYFWCSVVGAIILLLSVYFSQFY